MIRVRRGVERGHFDHGWLDTYHTFSFSRYFDAEQMGFRALRVINEDRIAPGQGFGTHGHRDMEIVTYVLEGALAHRDSLGSGGVLGPGELQRMTAGTGITHSEFNASETEPIHLYQIWLLPEREGLNPSYEQKTFPEAERRNRLRVVASPDGEDGSLIIRQDARLFLASIDAGTEITHRLDRQRHGWLQVLRGAVALSGKTLASGDGAAISDEPGVQVPGRRTFRSLVVRAVLRRSQATLDRVFLRRMPARCAYPGDSRFAIPDSRVIAHLESRMANPDSLRPDRRIRADLRTIPAPCAQLGILDSGFPIPFSSGTRIPDSEFRIPNSGIPNLESRIPNLESRIPNLESGIPNLESRISNPKSRIPNLESGIPNLESQISNLESRISSPESRILESRFSNPESRISNLESGISNLESGIPNPFLVATEGRARFP